MHVRRLEGPFRGARLVQDGDSGPGSVLAVGILRPDLKVPGVCAFRPANVQVGVVLLHVQLHAAALPDLASAWPAPGDLQMQMGKWEHSILEIDRNKKWKKKVNSLTKF